MAGSSKILVKLVNEQAAKDDYSGFNSEIFLILFVLFYLFCTHRGCAYVL